MALALRPDELKNSLAVKAARVIAAASQAAKVEGYDVSNMTMTLSEESELKGCWAVTFLPKEMLLRGGDLTVDVRPEEGVVVRVLLGQ